MTTQEQKDGDGKLPAGKNDEPDGEGSRKPGLIIEVVLPDAKPDRARDPAKQN